jgi:hypothetical protein
MSCNAPIGPTLSQDLAWLWADEQPHLFSAMLKSAVAEAQLVRRVLYCRTNPHSLDALCREAGFLAYKAALANAHAAWILTVEAEQAAIFVPELNPRYQRGITRNH